MGCTYSIDTERNFIEVKFFGTMSVAEKIAHDEKILDDPRFRPNMDAVCDLREVLFDWQMQDIDRLRSFVQKVRGRIGAARWAIVVNGGPTDFTAKVFTLLHLAYDKSIVIELFKTPEAATAWLECEQARAARNSSVLL